MMDVKHIPVCAEPDCHCCQMTLRVMETIGEPIDEKSQSESAIRGVALTKAIARDLYRHYRAAGFLDETDAILSHAEFFAALIITTIEALRENDMVSQ